MDWSIVKPLVFGIGWACIIKAFQKPLVRKMQESDAFTYGVVGSGICLMAITVFGF